MSAIPGAAPAGAVIKCPLCAWSHTVRENRCDDNTLAGVFGHGVMMQIDANRIAEETEKELADHFATHQTVEWLQRVTHLENLLRSYGVPT